jgi:ATP-dependent Zn protease
MSIVQLRGERRKVSYHEAGHAVAARKLGIAIAYIRIIRDNSGYGGAVVPSSITWEIAQASGTRAILAYLYADLMVALAGPAAERLAGYPDDREGLYNEDFEHAHNNAANGGLCSPLCRDPLRGSAWAAAVK